MKDYNTHRETTERIVYTMPGVSPASEVGKMWTIAEHDYRRRHGLLPGASLADNALEFRPHDEAIVISFVITRTGPLSSEEEKS